MAQRAIRGSWTVRFLAEIVGAELAGPQPEAMVVKGPKEKSAHVLELEREFTRAVGTKVEIEPKGSKGHQGRVVIEYYSLDDFERIQELLGQ